MSVSSGSDVTIPMQDSPPPPPSPYNTKGGGPPTGIENKAYSPSGSEKPPTTTTTTPTKKGDHTGVDVEAVNPELINMSIMSTIPAKPQSEFGPYEQMDDYFIPVNQHKKFLSRRSEKLYVTKDKRKEGGWKKCLCWTFAAFVLAAVVAVAILAAVGVIPQGSDTEGKLAQVGEVSTTSSSILDIIALSSSTTSVPPSSSEEPSTSPRPTRPPDDTHVGHAAKATFDITSLTFEAALANKSSSRFHELASQVEDEMRKVLREDANLENVTVRVDEFEPGSVHVKMFVSWGEEGMELEGLQRTLMGKSSLGPFAIGPVALYNIVNHCKFNNNNGCSHVCGYDYVSLEFACSCPTGMTLRDDRKTCDVEGGEEPQPESEPSSSSSPSEEPVSSSPEPEVEPEAEAAPETQAEPEPTAPQEEEVVVSSSVAPELGHLPVGDVSTTSTSTTTAEPRLDLAVGELEVTTEAPEGSEPEPEAPVEPEIVIAAPSSTTTSTTTETPLPPVVIPEEEEKTEDVAATTIAAPEESQDESVVETAVVPSQETPLQVAPLTPEPSTESTPVEEFPAESETARPSEEEEASRVNLEEEDSVFVHIPPPPSPSTTTSTATSTTTSTTTEVPAAAIIGETHSEPQEVDQLTSNLQRDSLEAVAVDEAPPTETPTAAPTPNEEVEIVQLTPGKSSEEGETSNSTSSERVGRQEGSFGSNSVEELPEVATTPPESTEAAPNSGEIMVYSDNRHASQQSGSSESSETSSADTHETVDVISANNPIELPALEPSPTATPTPSTAATLPSSSTSVSPSTSSLAPPPSIEVEVVAVEREETTTIRPISLEKDIDVNNEAGVTEDSVHTEDVDTSSGGGELPSLAAESAETEEVERPNRDHRNANSSAEETTISPVVVFDEVESEAEGVTTDAPSSTSTSTTASPPSSSTEGPLKNSTSSGSAESSGDNESENELH